MVAGPAVQETALYLNDLSRDTLDALREIAPPWSKNSTLVPTSVDKDGKITGYVDYSFTNPYDYLRRPVMGVINAINDGKELDLNANTITLNALGQFLSEVASPFAEESIIFRAAAQCHSSWWRTKTGAKVEQEPGFSGEIGFKSFAPCFRRIPAYDYDRFCHFGVSPARATLSLSCRVGLGAALLGPEGLDPRGNVRQLSEEVLRQLYWHGRS